MIEAAGSTQGLVFAKVLYTDLGQFSSGILDEVTEYIFFVVANEDDFSNARNFGNGAKTVPDYRMTCDIEQRLRIDMSLVLQAVGVIYRPWVRQVTMA